MSANESQETAGNVSENEPEDHGPFSLQPTGLVETTFAETLGLSMHNAIVNQQSSQMTTSASITNACARLLKIPIPAAAEQEEEESDGEQAGTEAETKEPSKPTRRFKIGNFFKGKNKEDTAEIKTDDRTDEQ